MIKNYMKIHTALLLLLVSCNESKFTPGVTATAQLPQTADAVQEESTAPVPEAPDAGIVTNPAPVESVEVPSAPAPTETITVEETYTQVGLNGSADIALVIDESGSMTEEQNNLSTKLGDLLSALKDSNWQIGVITTTAVESTSGDICKLTLIKSTDTDIESKFSKAVTPGIAGDGNEQGIRQAVNALSCPQTPWVRPDSTLAVLIVSDEDNCSADGKDCPTSPARTEQHLIDYVEKTLGRTVGKNAGFYVIFAPPGEECPTANAKGVQYQRLVNYKADGVMNYGNICDVSYKTTLERISSNIAKLLSSEFTVKQVPDNGSVTISGVKSNGDMITAADYVIKGSVATFIKGHEPALGSEITIIYKVTTIKAP